MLIPSKHSHPDQTVVAAATVILKVLRSKRLVAFDDLVDPLRKTAGHSAEFLFLPAASLLHLLGLVDYLPAVDSFEYTGA